MLAFPEELSLTLNLLLDENQQELKHLITNSLVIAPFSTKACLEWARLFRTFLWYFFDLRGISSQLPYDFWSGSIIFSDDSNCIIA